MKIIVLSAPWCTGCAALYRNVIAVASRHTIEVEKVDVEKSREVATRYGVMSLPTTIFLVDDKAVRTLIGAVSTATLEDTIKDITNRR